MPYSPDDQVTKSVKGLIDELEKHRESSEKYSKRLLWLTGVLATLTIVLILQGFNIL